MFSKRANVASQMNKTQHSGASGDTLSQQANNSTCVDCSFRCPQTVAPYVDDLEATVFQSRQSMLKSEKRSVNRSILTSAIGEC